MERLIPGPLGGLAVETGTCRGNGARQLAKYFPRVVTIELNSHLHELAQDRFRREGQSRIESLCGNSAELIPELVKGIPSSETVFFFLDAHWSGDSSVDWSRSSWKGYGLDTGHLGWHGETPLPEEQVPLAKELEAIVKHCRARAIVLVDDVDKLPQNGPGEKDKGFPGENWSHLSRRGLLEIVNSRVYAQHQLLEPSQWLMELR